VGLCVWGGVGVVGVVVGVVVVVVVVVGVVVVVVVVVVVRSPLTLTRWASPRKSLSCSRRE
jgi:uncharacterized membrane protein